MVKKREKTNTYIDSGFTLLELLVVMIIIGILSAIAVLGIRGATQTSKVTSCRVDVNSVYSATLAYQYDSQNLTATSSLSGNIDSSGLTTTISGISPGTSNLNEGMLLTKYTGGGVLGAGATIVSVISSSQLRISSLTASSPGSLTSFNASFNPTLRTNANPLYPKYIQPLSQNKFYQIGYRWNTLSIASAQIQSATPTQISYTLSLPAGITLDPRIWGVGNTITVLNNSVAGFNVVNSAITYFDAASSTIGVGTTLTGMGVGSGGVVVSSVPTVEVMDLLSNSVTANSDPNVPETACVNLS